MFSGRGKAADAKDKAAKGKTHREGGGKGEKSVAEVEGKAVKSKSLGKGKRKAAREPDEKGLEGQTDGVAKGARAGRTGGRKASVNSEVNSEVKPALPSPTTPSNGAPALVRAGDWLSALCAGWGRH